MSNRESCIKLIDSFTDNQLGALLNVIAAFKTALDTAVDDAFCEKLLKDYEESSDSDKETMSSDEVAKLLGIKE